MMKVSMYLGDVFSYHVVHQILHFMRIYVLNIGSLSKLENLEKDIRFSGQGKVGRFLENDQKDPEESGHLLNESGFQFCFEISNTNAQLGLGMRHSNSGYGKPTLVIIY